MNDFIVLSRSDGIGIITLNRPKVGVSWCTSVARQLDIALKTIEFDDSLSAAVLTVAGPPSRLISVFDDPLAHGQRAAVHQEWEDLFETMCRLKKPRVAAINSIAAGSAFQVALLCDIRIAHSRSLIGLPGWVSKPSGSYGGAVVERDQHLRAVANGQILNSRLVPADACFALGLVNEIVAEEDLMVEASMLAQNLAAIPANLYSLPKRRIWELSSQELWARIELSKVVYMEAMRAATPSKALKRLMENRAKSTL